MKPGRGSRIWNVALPWRSNEEKAKWTPASGAGAAMSSRAGSVPGRSDGRDRLCNFWYDV